MYAEALYIIQVMFKVTSSVMMDWIFSILYNLLRLQENMMRSYHAEIRDNIKVWPRPSCPSCSSLSNDLCFHIHSGCLMKLSGEHKYVLHFFPLTASQAAAQARNTAGQQSAAASSITGMTVQEAQQILNISTLTPEEIQKVQTHSLVCHSSLLSSWKWFLELCKLFHCATRRGDRFWVGNTMIMINPAEGFSQPKSNEYETLTPSSGLPCCLCLIQFYTRNTVLDSSELVAFWPFLTIYSC